MLVQVAVLIGSVKESEGDVWGDKDWENNTCDVSLWTIDLGGRFALWPVAGNERNVDVDGGKDSKVTWTCRCKDETARDSKEGKDEDRYDSAWAGDVNNGTNELLVGSDGSAEFNNAGSNGFANGNGVNKYI